MDSRSSAGTYPARFVNIGAMAFTSGAMLAILRNTVAKGLPEDEMADIWAEVAVTFSLKTEAESAGNSGVGPSAGQAAEAKCGGK